jgi:hypothetical protein
MGAESLLKCLGDRQVLSGLVTLMLIEAHCRVASRLLRRSINWLMRKTKWSIRIQLKMQLIVGASPNKARSQRCGD